jgi:hypothetical protein
VCRALEGDGADRNLPIRGVAGQFLVRHVFNRMTHPL